MKLDFFKSLGIEKWVFFGDKVYLSDSDIAVMGERDEQFVLDWLELLSVVILRSIFIKKKAFIIDDNTVLKIVDMDDINGLVFALGFEEGGQSLIFLVVNELFQIFISEFFEFELMNAARVKLDNIYGDVIIGCHSEEFANTNLESGFYS